MGVLEIHSFLGRWPDLARPTAVLFDLDPSAPADLLTAAEAALALREELGPEAWVKTSGSLGLHVLVPTTAASYAETRAEAHAFALRVRERRPDLVTVEMKRAGREGKVLIDTRQNSERLTMVVPWSLRTTPQPLVSMPLSWSEVEHAVASRDEKALVFDARAALERS
jgi:bifunctional non-homologous end joining protein LigD